MAILTRRKLSAAFWIFFIFAAAALISGMITGVYFLDIIIAAAIIATGFHGVLEELSRRDSKMELRKLSDSVQQLSEWLEKSHLFSKSIKERQDLRLHHLDTKRAQVEQKLEKTGREISKRIVDLENRLNSLRKELAESPKPLAAPERRIARSIAVLRKEGMISSQAYSRRLGVSRPVAIKDLARMARMGIAKKRGSGRNAYYIIGI